MQLPTILINCLQKNKNKTKNTLAYKRNRKKIATVPFKSKLTLNSQSSHESRIETRDSILDDYVSILDECVLILD